MSAPLIGDLPPVVRIACRLLIEDPASGERDRNGLTAAGEALLRALADASPGTVRPVTGEARMSAEAAVARARRLLAKQPALQTAARALRTVTRWTGPYRDGRTGRAMNRAEARRTCRAAMSAGLDAVALVDGDVLIVRVLEPGQKRAR